jgi:hypothetical protein
MRCLHLVQRVLIIAGVVDAHVVVDNMRGG